ncbi:PH domain-containing protein [Sarocladium implicatum]|nr:PH domain-containing protein [Sarocladium implicatum]
MAETQLQRAVAATVNALPMPIRKNKDPVGLSRLDVEAVTPIREDGCFEFDRVIKSGHVQKRTQKRKNWKTVFLVLRPNTLSIYRNEKEDRLRHQIHLSDLTAVAFLKDPKHKRKNVFGLFSPSRNFHLEASSAQEAKEWVDKIRERARIEEEEEELLLASPTLPPRNMPSSFGGSGVLLSSSPEPLGHFPPTFAAPNSSSRRKSSYMESSGLSGNELASHSDFSDNDVQRWHGASIESLAVQDPPVGSTATDSRPVMQNRTNSQLSFNATAGAGATQNSPNNNDHQDPDRVIWQGWLWALRTKGGVRQWKDLWGVLRPRNLILYKDSSEYTAQRIIRLSAIVDVVDVDPLSRSKTNCLQVITEEKSYRFCAHDEEALVRCLGAFKSLLAKRRELEARQQQQQQATAGSLENQPAVS